LEKKRTRCFRDATEVCSRKEKRTRSGPKLSIWELRVSQLSEKRGFKVKLVISYPMSNQRDLRAGKWSGGGFPYREKITIANGENGPMGEESLSFTANLGDRKERVEH